MPFIHRKRRNRFKVLAFYRRRRPQDKHIGSGNGVQRSVRKARNPRHERAIVKSNDEFHAHGHTASHALDETNEIRGDTSRWHEVNERNGPVFSLEGRLQDQGII